MAAASILTFVAGCSTSADVPLVLDTDLPPWPAEIAGGCRDPGVAEDAVDTIAETRLALGECRRKNDGKDHFYNDVRTIYGGDHDETDEVSDHRRLSPFWRGAGRGRVSR